MVINNTINSPFPTSLSKGGTNANLTPSNGGIFYSTASDISILSGTPTAGQMLQSGTSAPAWSTATYPSTTTANQLLYSSSNNIIGGLSTANSACLVSDDILLPFPTSFPVWSSSMTDGQIIIGGSGGRPIASNLTRGTGNVKIANAPNQITISSGISSFEWISTQTVSGPGITSLNFDNCFSPNYKSYRLILNNILLSSSGLELYLRFGTGTGPINYISSGEIYLYQGCAIGEGGSTNFYHGYNSVGFNQVNLTITNIHGPDPDPNYGGICGIINLFVNPSDYSTAKGISRLCFKVDSISSFFNYTTSFQAYLDNYTSVQLVVLFDHLSSGSATLYGLTAS